MLIGELAVGQPDSADALVKEIYVRQRPFYAIYRTEQRVMVQYADDNGVAAKQRSDMMPLAPLRGCINSLIDGWRTSRRPSLNAKAQGYDRLVADALAVAFTPDVDGARGLLEQAKAQIMEERISWGRFQYLTVASVVAITIVVLASVVQAVLSQDTAAWIALMAIGSGTVGAFFSIAIGIRGRTILPDTHYRDNAADALLRVVIGFIAAVVAVGLVRLGAINLSFGGTEPTSGSHPILFALLVAFVAGFSERLIPDLLDKAMPAQLQAPAGPPSADQPHVGPASLLAQPQPRPAAPVPAQAQPVFPTPASQPQPARAVPIDVTSEPHAHGPDWLRDVKAEEHDIVLPALKKDAARVEAQ